MQIISMTVEGVTFTGLTIYNSYKSIFLHMSIYFLAIAVICKYSIVIRVQVSSVQPHVGPFSFIQGLFPFPNVNLPSNNIHIVPLTIRQVTINPISGPKTLVNKLICTQISEIKIMQVNCQGLTDAQKIRNVFFSIYKTA